ncbi:MAG TPA: FIST N-terminal domain-containing protein [Anaerolineales bacterium]|jgi:hypothetical protein
MTLIGATGQADVTDPRQAGMQAVSQALNGLGKVSPSLCLIIVPHRYDPQLVINGAASVLTNVPMIGFSVSSGLAADGAHSQSVIVGILGGDSLQAETHWFPAYSQSTAEAATRIMQLLGYEQRPANNVIVFADGLNADTEEFCNNLPAGLPVLGGLASGSLVNANTFQIAGMQSGSGALAAAFLRGNFKIGTGYGHGWHPVGGHFRVTRARGFWLRTLDGHPASETYAQLFGKPSREWSAHPLNTMCRIYPLGFEQDYTEELLVRAPIRVEADGSLRMNSFLRDGSDAYLMVGSPADCQNTAREAAKQAQAQLGRSKPAFALVLVDMAWQMLLQAQPGQEIKVVQEVLGESVPILGGYTLGQIVPPQGQNTRPKFLNQHILVAVFSDSDKPD